ncbi:hypothetical protein [Streptomyces halobius]|uniref:Uncharacterized protein n=1 Tax=Streptomyces halobius TaxID=2879846 RepID=A0ABY4M1N1_9ACTN|nr:hypothetical protein [Streptomyces halobius]UQA91659.1 hypothetical protein K9S39_07090 [Streptomyces halobius]
MERNNLPKEPEALWALLADVLNALEDAGESPTLEGWDTEGRDVDDRTYLPGIRRQPEDGHCWHRRITWNADNSTRWVATEGGTWEWPETERTARLNELAKVAKEIKRAGDGSLLRNPERVFRMVSDLAEQAT